MGTVSPFGSRYYDVGGVLSLIVTNVNLSAANADDAQTFSFSLQLNSKRVDDSYFPTVAQIFVKLEAPDLTNWFAKDLFGVSGAQSPFPNPFLVGENRFLHFPLATPNQVAGSVTVYSTSMDLVSSTSQTSLYLAQLGMQVFRWNGRNEGNELVGSGIYFYFIQTPSGTSKGKVAVIRK